MPDLLARLESEKKRADDMADLFLRAVEAFALVIEAKDHTTEEHLHRVQIFALEIGSELGLDSIELDALKIAALLHDIGKLGVPDRIISKPGRLTPEEFAKYKIHPSVGADILEQVRFPYPVASIVRAHHEKWDGSGYPSGLKGEQIPIGARILGAVDYFDALASERQYRRALPIEEVVSRLNKESGKSFDPKVVDVLRRRHVELEQLVKIRTNDLTKTSFLHRKLRIEGTIAFDPESAGEDIKSTEVTFLPAIAAARQEAQALFELSEDLGASLSLGETLSVFAVKLRRLIPYDSIAVYILRGGELIPELVTGEDHRLFSNLRIPMGKGVSGWVAENRRPIINGDPSTEAASSPKTGEHTALKSALSVPLEGLGNVVGVVTLCTLEAGAFTVDHLRMLLAISNKMALVVENALTYEVVRSVAETDYLTGLPNIRSFYLNLDREITRCSRSETQVAVVVFELRGFGGLEARQGNKTRIQTLRAASQAIGRLFAETDFVARTGDNEFAAFFPEQTFDDALRKAKSVVEGVNREIGGSPGAAASLVAIGASVFPDDGDKAESLLDKAQKREELRTPLSVAYAEDGQLHMRALRAFLCHSSTDKPLVRDLFRRLRADGVDAWLDEAKLLAGQDWRKEIRKAVRNSDAVIVCLSKKSVTREGFVQAELKYALDVADEKPEGTIYLIPLLIEECDVPERLRHWQWVSYLDPDWYLSLFKALDLRASLVGNP